MSSIHAPSAATLSVESLSGCIGAEVDVDLRNIDDDVFAAIHAAFLEHVVLVFPGQQLSASEQVAFARRFGELYLFPHAPGIDGHPEILGIFNLKGGIGEGRWHSDATFDACPPALSILAAQALPSRGGETGFANQYVAYETLSPGMQEMIGRLQAVHDASSHGRREEDATHPVVRTHPLTGRKALFVNSEFTRRFAHMTRRESEGLLSFLTQHAHRPEFCYTHRWRAGDVVMWDNRAAQHYPVVNTPAGEERRMWRVTVAGDAPR